jgi:hypothetical protein
MSRLSLVTAPTIWYVCVNECVCVCECVCECVYLCVSVVVNVCVCVFVYELVVAAKKIFYVTLSQADLFLGFAKPLGIPAAALPQGERSRCNTSTTHTHTHTHTHRCAQRVGRGGRLRK